MKQEKITTELELHCSNCGVVYVTCCVDKWLDTPETKNAFMRAEEIVANCPNCSIEIVEEIFFDRDGQIRDGSNMANILRTMASMFTFTTRN